MERVHFRAMMLYDFKVDLTEEECFIRLTKAFPDEAPAQRTVERWYAKFQEGKFDLNDEERIGRPISVVNDVNTQAVAALVKENPRITYEEIEHMLGISAPSIFTILHEHLKLRKVSCRWVPHLLKEKEKQERVRISKEIIEKFQDGQSPHLHKILTGDETWVYCFEPELKQQSKQWIGEGDSRPAKVVKNRYCGKQMAVVFFTSKGLVKIVLLEPKQTVTAKWYSDVCLDQVFAALKKDRRLKGFTQIWLHHDNASVHTAHYTKNYLEGIDCNLLDHPPHSPDLAPADFFLFREVKNRMRGIQYRTKEDATAAFAEIIESLTIQDWESCFKDWFNRYNRCIEANGDYFEGK